MSRCSSGFSRAHERLATLHLAAMLKCRQATAGGWSVLTRRRSRRADKRRLPGRSVLTCAVQSFRATMLPSSVYLSTDQRALFR